MWSPGEERTVTGMQHQVGCELRATGTQILQDLLNNPVKCISQPLRGSTFPHNSELHMRNARRLGQVFHANPREGNQGAGLSVTLGSWWKPVQSPITAAWAGMSRFEAMAKRCPTHCRAISLLVYPLRLISFPRQGVSCPFPRGPGCEESPIILPQAAVTEIR